MQIEKKIVVLGASGMLGNAVVRYFAKNSKYDVFGTVRNSTSANRLKQIAPAVQLLPLDDIADMDALTDVFTRIRPNVVVNCVGVVKQLEKASDPLIALPINAIFPHRLARLAQLARARLVHFSTDCVFSGTRGNYNEDDEPDARDVYGRSKLLGEVDYPNAITLRTSIIGHEIAGTRSLVDWFLSQNGTANGFQKAIFSGLPTVELARVIHDFIIPNDHLHGLYHVSASPISKYDLLKLIAQIYGKPIDVIPVNGPEINRSLDSSRFQSATGFKAEAWPELVGRMHGFR